MDEVASDAPRGRGGRSLLTMGGVVNGSGRVMDEADDDADASARGGERVIMAEGDVCTGRPRMGGWSVDCRLPDDDGREDDELEPVTGPALRYDGGSSTTVPPSVNTVTGAPPPSCKSKVESWVSRSIIETFAHRYYHDRTHVMDDKHVTTHQTLPFAALAGCASLAQLHLLVRLGSVPVLPPVLAALQIRPSPRRGAHVGRAGVVRVRVPSHRRSPAGRAEGVRPRRGRPRLVFATVCEADACVGRVAEQGRASVSPVADRSGAVEVRAGVRGRDKVGLVDGGKQWGRVLDLVLFVTPQRAQSEQRSDNERSDCDSSGDSRRRPRAGRLCQTGRRSSATDVQPAKEGVGCVNLTERAPLSSTQ